MECYVMMMKGSEKKRTKKVWGQRLRGQAGWYDTEQMGGEWGRTKAGDNLKEIG
jgi:hypothetical protein